MSKEKTIHELELHEVLNTDVGRVIRVSGGWLYQDYSLNTTCFVPLSSEFKPPIKLETPKYKEEDVNKVILGIRNVIKALKLQNDDIDVRVFTIKEESKLESLKQHETALEILRTHTR